MIGCSQTFQIGDIKIYLKLGKEILAKTQVPIWDVPVDPVRDGEEPPPVPPKLERTSAAAAVEVVALDPLNVRPLNGELVAKAAIGEPETPPQAGATSDIIEHGPKAGFP